MKGQSKKDVENLCSNSKVQRILNAIDFSRNNKSASGLFYSESLFCSREKIIRAKNTKKKHFELLCFSCIRLEPNPAETIVNICFKTSLKVFLLFLLCTLSFHSKVFLFCELEKICHKKINFEHGFVEETIEFRVDNVSVSVYLKITRSVSVLSFIRAQRE